MNLRTLVYVLIISIFTLQGCTSLNFHPIRMVNRSANHIHRALVLEFGESFFERPSQDRREYQSIPFLYSNNKLVKANGTNFYLKAFVAIHGDRPYSVRVMVYKYTDKGKKRSYSRSLSKNMAKKVRESIYNSPESHDLLESFRVF